jgi:hypothetical protein
VLLSLSSCRDLGSDDICGHEHWNGIWDLGFGDLGARVTKCVLGGVEQVSGIQRWHVNIKSMEPAYRTI